MMKTMYTWSVTTDNEVEFSKDEEIISIPQDRLAAHVESFMEEEDADYYASHLINETYDIYKRELEKESKHKHRKQRSSFVHRVKRLMINFKISRCVKRINKILSGGNSHEA